MGSQGSLGGIHGYLGGTDGTLGPMGPWDRWDLGTDGAWASRTLPKRKIPEAGTYPGAGYPATRARCRMPATGPVVRRAEIFRIFFSRPGRPGPVLWLFLIEKKTFLGPKFFFIIFSL